MDDKFEEFYNNILMKHLKTWGVPESKVLKDVFKIVFDAGVRAAKGQPC